MEDVFARVWENLLGRLTGPLEFRLLLQPAIALYFGIRDGLKDAGSGAPPYFWAIFTDPTHRRLLLREGWQAVFKVFAAAVAVDVIYQIVVIRFVYPGEALLVAFLLALLPYLLVRGPANRIARAFNLERREPVGAHPVARHEEMTVAVLLSLAALASSWCGYQAARWSGIQTWQYNESLASRTESTRADGTANQLMAIDVNLFSSWLDATATDRNMLADFYRQRFRPEFKPAFEAWLATGPLRNPEAPPTPFRLPEYRLAEAAQATELARKADLTFDLAQQANQTSDNYVLTTVILSSVMFLGGIAGNFDQRAVRGGMMAVATFLLVFALRNIIVYPVG